MMRKSTMLRSRIGTGPERMKSTVWSSIFTTSFTPVT